MAANPFAKLSPRQRECLKLVAELKDSQQIGHELGISPKTVNGYIADAVALLGARNRRHAAKMLLDHDGAAAPDKMPGHFLRLEGETSTERASEVQFNAGADEDTRINALREVPRAYSAGAEPARPPNRLPLLGGNKQPGDIKPGLRLALIFGTSLASGFGFLLLALAAVGLLALAGYLRP